MGTSASYTSYEYSYTNGWHWVGSAPAYSIETVHVDSNQPFALGSSSYGYDRWVATGDPSNQALVDGIYSYQGYMNSGTFQPDYSFLYTPYGADVHVRAAWGMPTTDSEWDLASGESGYFDPFPSRLNASVKSYYESKDESFNNAMKALANDLKESVFQDSEYSSHAVTSGYAYDRGYRSSVGAFHAGMDIKANVGDDVYSPIGGVVQSVVSSGKNSYVSVVDDLYGNTWIFGHITGFVSEGDVVSVGTTVLGEVLDYPSSAGGNGDHLHIEVQDFPDPNNNFNWGQSASLEKILTYTQSPLEAFYNYSMFS